MRKNILEKILVSKTDNTLVQLFRYGCVGGGAFVADFGTLYMLTSICGLYYILSATIAFTVGLLTNYAFSKLYVFSRSKVKNKTKEFVVFAFIGVIGLVITDALMWLETDILGFHYIMSKAGATIIVFFWNFFARKLLLF